MNFDITPFIRIAGMLHFTLLIASVLTPKVLRWDIELRKLDSTTRQIVWVHNLFINLTIIGFGTIATLFASSLADGMSLARAFCAFVAIFWTTRMAIQFVLFDPGPLLSTTILKLGYHGLTVVFTYFGIVFGLAALRPAWL